jgi:hypothetical protein
MGRFHRRGVRALVGLLSLGSVALVPGCDWLKASDMVQRSSPFLSNLRITPSSVLCGQEFTVAFSFDDPQGDIFQAKFSYQHVGDSTVREQTELWPDNVSRSAGTVSIPSQIPCGSPGGTWVLTVTVEDDRGHLSNEVTQTVTLNAAG